MKQSKKTLTAFKNSWLSETYHEDYQRWLHKLSNVLPWQYKYQLTWNIGQPLFGNSFQPPHININSNSCINNTGRETIALAIRLFKILQNDVFFYIKTMTSVTRTHLFSFFMFVECPKSSWTYKLSCFFLILR